MAGKNSDMETLRGLRTSMAKIKSDIAKREGEREAELKALKKDFDVDDLDGAYALLKKLDAHIEDTSRERSKLIASAKKRLEEFGYE